MINNLINDCHYSIYIITIVYYCTCMSLCIINTCSPIQMYEMCAWIHSSIKNKIKRYKHGFRGIVLSRKRSPSHFFIRTLYAYNAFTFALRSVRAYRFKSAHCAFTKRLLFAHRSFSVYIYIGQSRFFHSELQSDRIGLGVLKTK